VNSVDIKASSVQPPAVAAFVQARMSSRRFPGKVLAPFKGQPVIRHVLAAVSKAVPTSPIVLATSSDASDDPLAAYVSSLEIPVHRGSLEDVFGRFRTCLDRFPCAWVLRVSGDSPLLDPRIVRALVDRVEQSSRRIDLVTTIFPRTFPRGQNAELIRAETLRGVDLDALTGHDREHVTPFFYRNPERFQIVNVTSGAPRLADMSFAVDTLEDLGRLEAAAAVPAFAEAIDI
jgi:spore coat polysaccharide biosynthesis protein SpsF